MYGHVTAVAGGLTAAGLMRQSRCAGWVVADVLYHQLLDAHRALRAFATPAAGPPDRDYVSLKGTGREPLTEQDRELLGRLPHASPSSASTRWLALPGQRSPAAAIRPVTEIVWVSYR
jgi:hypothetical protein